MSGLCRVNFPLYCCQSLDDGTFIVAGGGGAAKTGVKNAVEVFELKRLKKKCIASSISQLETGSNAVMSMSVCSLGGDRWKLAVSKGNRCCIYEVVRTTAESTSRSKDANNKVLTKRKGGPSLEARDNQGVADYKFNLLNEFEVIPGEGGFQTCVKLSDDGRMVVSGGSDGNLRSWKVPKQEPIFDSLVSKDEVTDVDISPDAKQVISISRDGRSCLWCATSGHKTMDLHSIWNEQMSTRAFKFRNCRFGTLPGQESRYLLFTSHSPVKNDKKTYCCITKWARKRDKEGEEVGDFIPAVVQATGKEAISTITVSENGLYLGVGFMEGSVAIYISFSLQCAQRFTNVHSIFVTSLSFLPDSSRAIPMTGECDAALVSVSADCTCHLSKLASRAMFSLWFGVVLCILTLVGAALYLHHIGVI